MKKILQISILLLTVVFMSSCNDGDPGPAGKDGSQGAKGDKGEQGEPGSAGDVDLKSGFISGSITGTRRDKTAFQETFKYEYLNGIDGFNSNGLLYLSRVTEDFGRMGYMYMELEFTEKNNPTLPIYLNSFLLNFSKEIAPGQLFVFNTSTSDVNSHGPTTVQYPLSIANNDSYQVDYTRAFKSIRNGITYYGALTDDNSFVFYTLDDKIVHYSNIGVTAGDYKKVSLLKVTDVNGNEIDPGAFAGTSFYYKTAGPESYIEDADGKNLSGQEVWNFNETISDYHFNTTTGTVTYSYSIEIPAPLNSSGHAATLSGDVEVKIYDEVLARVGEGH